MSLSVLAPDNMRTAYNKAHTEDSLVNHTMKGFYSHVDAVDSNRRGNNKKRILLISQLEIYHKTNTKHLLGNKIPTSCRELLTADQRAKVTDRQGKDFETAIKPLESV